MQSISRELLRVPGVMGVFLCTREGLPVAMALLSETQAEHLSALTAAVFADVERTVARLGLGSMTRGSFQSQDGIILLLATGEFILGVKTSIPVNLGLVQLEMLNCAQHVDRFIHAMSTVSSV